MDIAISLDDYEDLFSDFDKSRYGDRALSRDFLDELHLRLSKARDVQELTIALVVPKRRRKEDAEPQIIERLYAFFAERVASCGRDDRNILLRGLAFIGIGLALSILANFIAGSFLKMPLFNDFFLIPSWFFVWSGFDYLIKREELRKKKRYYEKLRSSRMVFRSAAAAPRRGILGRELPPTKDDA